MNPSGYKARYVNMKVYLEDGKPRTVRVEKYLLKSLNYKSTGNDAFMQKLRKYGMDMILRVDTGKELDLVDRAMNEREQSARKRFHMKLSVGEERPDGTHVMGTLDDRIVTDKTGGKIVGEVYGERDWGELAHYAFLGKGSPEACQIVLQLAHHWKLTDEAGLQSYADNWLGLDCNGFVGNYLWHDRKGNAWTEIGVHNWELGPDSLISGFFEGKKRLTDWDAMDPGTTYLMGMCDKFGNVIKGGAGVASAGHIVITEPNRRQGQPGGKIPFSVGVVESTYGHLPEGLSENWYTFKSVKGTVFTLDRGDQMKPDSREIPMVIVPVTL